MNVGKQHFFFRYRWHAPVLLLILGCSLFAQALELRDISAERTAVSADSSLTEDSRTALLAELDLAETQLQAADKFRARTAEFTAVMEGAEALSQKYEQQLDAAKEKQQAGHPEDLAGSAEELEGRATLVVAERQAMSDRRAHLLQEIDELPARRAAIKQRLVELQSAGESGPTDTTADTSQMTAQQRVNRILEQARSLARAAEIESLQAEVLSESSRGEVSAAERAWLGFAIDMADARLELLNAALERASTSATRQEVQTTAELQEQLQDRDPALQDFAQGNRSLAEQLQVIASRTDTARREGLQIQAMLERIEQDSALMHRRLEVAGRKEVLGRFMITRLDSLPDTDAIKRDISRRDELIADVSLIQIDMEEDFRALNERQDYVARLVPDLDSLRQDERDLVNNLVDQRATLLERGLKSQGTLLQRLLDNNDISNELAVATKRFHRFLLGNLLWVRNFTFFEIDTMSSQLAVLFSPAQWSQLPSQLASGYRKQSWSAILLLGFFVSLLLRWRFSPVYERLLNRPILLSGATLWHMVGGLLLTMLLVLPWPLLLYIIGYYLQSAEPATEFNDALAPALMYTALILYLLLFTRLIASRMGVGRRFLKWDARMLDSIRHELNWAGPVVCTAFLVEVFAFHLDVVASGGPLGALATAAIATTIIVFSLRLLKQEIFTDSTLLPLSLRIAAFIGLVVIAMQLLGLLFAAEIYLVALGRSIVMLLLIKVVADLFERWLVILRARLERQAREELKQLEDNSEETEEDGEELVDVISLSEAHSKLLTLGRFVATTIALWVIWSPSLPALTLLDSVVLWHVTDTSGPGAVERAISLFDLSLSVVILVITGLITKHLPSLSEVFMREWFNMSAGARYASSILMQYLVIAIGGSMFLTTIGWEWGKVQWLVAAMGVGIGFGLQEIVANFISGIIILFERPVRVGDIISAGGAEGTVKKINPRATIIETFDRKEHLIPNKELITGQVINWTLSDAAVRVIIPVGIAYGSDVRQAMALLLQAAGEVNTVLNDPEPRASFEDFGDNSLLLWLRCYASEDRIGTWTELRTVINEKFTEAGIVIAFPQRDIHLDTLEPLQIEINDPRPNPA